MKLHRADPSIGLLIHFLAQACSLVTFQNRPGRKYYSDFFSPVKMVFINPAKSGVPIQVSI